MGLCVSVFSFFPLYSGLSCKRDAELTETTWWNKSYISITTGFDLASLRKCQPELSFHQWECKNKKMKWLFDSSKLELVLCSWRTGLFLRPLAHLLFRHPCGCFFLVWSSLWWDNKLLRNCWHHDESEIRSQGSPQKKLCIAKPAGKIKKVGNLPGGWSWVGLNYCFLEGPRLSP